MFYKVLALGRSGHQTFREIYCTGSVKRKTERWVVFSPNQSVERLIVLKVEFDIFFHLL